MTLLKDLGALLGKGLTEDRVGVRQRHHEEGNLDLVAAEKDLRLAEVDLSLTRPVAQGDEDLRLTLPPSANGVLHDGQAAVVLMLQHKPVEDALGGMPLLLRGLLVRLQNLMDDRKKPLQLGLFPWLSLPIARGLLVL